MRLAICLGWMMTVGLLSGQQTAHRPADDKAVRDVIAKYMEARELRDPSAIEQLFTADADQHTSSGEWRRGRANVVPGTLESSKRNPGARAIKVEAVRFLTPDVAIADGPYEIGTGSNIRPMWTTIVVTRTSDGWRIAAIRNMVPTATGSTAGR
ncbi:MAG: SgcJ/EcaC family oxidoreductase [Vicinamibacterales bacterium]